MTTQSLIGLFLFISWIMGIAMDDLPAAPKIRF